ncbi:MAG: family transposase [Acidimicrobiaceae bacterium]|nr:family transposase [Acidimicrobiaceae bacterium]
MLEAMARSRSIPRRVAVEARALCLAADGMSSAEVARRCDIGADTVRRWKARFALRGVEGVGTIAPGRGRKPTCTPLVVARILDTTANELPPDGRARWSTRTLAKRLGLSKDTVARVWQAHGVRPTEDLRVEPEAAVN